MTALALFAIGAAWGAALTAHVLIKRPTVRMRDHRAGPGVGL